MAPRYVYSLNPDMDPNMRSAKNVHDTLFSKYQLLMLNKTITLHLLTYVMSRVGPFSGIVCYFNNAHYLQFCGGESSEGIFVGAFLSMSSTAVVMHKMKLF